MLEIYSMWSKSICWKRSLVPLQLIHEFMTFSQIRDKSQDKAECESYSLIICPSKKTRRFSSDAIVVNRRNKKIYLRFHFKAAIQTWTATTSSIMPCDYTGIYIRKKRKKSLLILRRMLNFNCFEMKNEKGTWMRWKRRKLAYTYTHLLRKIDRHTDVTWRGWKWSAVIHHDE